MTKAGERVTKRWECVTLPTTTTTIRECFPSDCLFSAPSSSPFPFPVLVLQRRAKEPNVAELRGADGRRVVD
jgi:hypothetical protein